MITLKNPTRFIAIVAGATAYFLLGDVHLGLAFLLGAFVGSFSINGKN